MMNRSKLSISLLALLLVASSGFADTVITVGPGGQYASLGAAFDALDYNDGQNDVVVMKPGFINDEVLTPKADTGADSVGLPHALGVLNLTVSAQILDSHPDSLTVKSEDPNNPGVITLTDAGQVVIYSIQASDGNEFGDPASIYIFCKDLTFDGVEIRNGTAAAYCLTGQASELTFQDCLFSNHGAAGQEDYWNMNNDTLAFSSETPTVGLDNTYAYDGCTFDMRDPANNQSLDHQILYMHGYTSATAPNTGTNFMNNCLFKNLGDSFGNEGFAVEIRGRQNGGVGGGNLSLGFASQVIQNSFAVNCLVRPPFDYKGTHGQCKFVGNVTNNISGAIRIENRDQWGPGPLYIGNNLIVGGGTAAGALAGIDYRCNGNQGGFDVHVVNNTFFNYGTAPAILCTGGNPGVLVAANNIFEATTAAAQGIAIDGQNFATLTATLTNNGYFNNTTNVNGTPSGGETGAVTTDPAFAADGSGGFAAVGGPTDLNVPSAPLKGSDFTDRVGRQNFIPTGGSYVNGGSNAAYDSGIFGSVDVDRLNARVGGASIDIGAQESDGASLVAAWDQY